MNSPARPISAVCFDLYSTLVHEDADNPFYRRVADELGYDAEIWLPAYRRRGSDSMTGRVAGMADRVRLAGADVGLVRPEAAVRAAVDRHFPAFAASVSVDGQAAGVLAALGARGLRLALVSNASRYSEGVLDRLDLRPYFDSIVLSYRVGRLKPEPEIYHRALRELGVAASSCVFVGDGGDRELHGARSLGMRTVLVLRPLAHALAARDDADHVVEDLARAGELISRLVKGR